MKPPDEPLRLLVHQWLAKAGIDYMTAESLLRDPNPIRESVAFHCQQAVEKYLKALLVQHQVEFPKTHSIAQLLDLVSAFAPELATSLDGAVALTPFGVQIRYPGDFAELLPGQEQDLFAMAARTRSLILNELGLSS